MVSTTRYLIIHERYVMKINGKIIEGPKPEVIVIPKGEDEYVFKAMPILDYEDFDKLCPVPLPPEKVLKGGEVQLDINDKEYSKKLTEWSKQKLSWMTLTSLSATEGLEWDTVDMSDPTTWENYTTELKSSFTDAEIQMIVSTVFTACGLNQDKIDEATKRFLAGQGQEQNT